MPDVVQETPTTVTVKKKPWYKSKTIWANLIGTGIEVVSTTAGLPIPPKTLTYISFVGNILLRLISKSKITATNPES
jgi:hypothetical protein